MPQIKVNEIDQSVVTRVVSDDRVKILVPVITSFGKPYDETQASVQTFTDVTAFDRAFGYTAPQFDPIKNDHTRMYARELIKKGAAVSAVRINNDGATAQFNIGTQATTTPTFANVCPAVMFSEDFKKNTAKLDKKEITFTADEGTYTSGSYTVLGVDVNSVIRGSVVAEVVIGTKTYVFKDNGSTYKTTELNGKGILKCTDGTITDTGSYIDYTSASTTAGKIVLKGLTGTVTSATVSYQYVDTTKITASDYYKYTFCPQIASITAKYPGSFGNNLVMTISAVVTANLTESFQYANISVYYVERNIVYDEFGDIDYTRTTVKNTTRLETKMVSTNPNDARYFEEVDFDFIKIVAVDGAREQLSLIWSNILANPVSNERYPGFPTITLMTPLDNGYNTYNYGAFANYDTDTYGTDFNYQNRTGATANFSTNLLDKLKQGFKGFITGSDSWTQNDVNEYNAEVYGYDDVQAPIFTKLMSNLKGMYANYSDPYMYDFDFITSGGLVYEEYTPAYKVIKVGNEDVTTTELIAPRTVPGAGNTYAGVNVVHAAMKNLVETRQDCIALFDVPSYYDVAGDGIVEYSRLLNTSYGTMHFPWCYVASPDISGMQILMAPSYIFLYTFLQNLDNNTDAQKWFPPAGVDRATARVVKRPEFEMGTTLLNRWQNETTARVNPIMKLKQYGYVIYGQYTNLEAIDMFTHSALESLNVRLISNVVKKKIFDVCLKLAFEPNTENLWNKFFAQMDEFLRYMQYNEGVYKYKIVMDESTVTTDDINHLRCPGKVYIAPTRTAEFFDIDFIITDSGAQFNN